MTILVKDDEKIIKSSKIMDMREKKFHESSARISCRQLRFDAGNARNAVMVMEFIKSLTKSIKKFTKLWLF